MITVKKTADGFEIKATTADEAIKVIRELETIKAEITVQYTDYVECPECGSEDVEEMLQDEQGEVLLTCNECQTSFSIF